jgi:alkylation response protein AidB-like acyl-CoA dehydrogenase
MNNAKMTQIYDGVGEILKVAIARRVLAEGERATR